MNIDILIPFFYAFKSEELPLWLSLCIFFVTGVILFLYIFNFYVPVFKTVRHIRKKLEDINGKSQFAENFDAIDYLFSHKIVKHNWDKLKDTFIFPDKYDEVQNIKNTVRPQKYLNFDNCSEQFSLNFYHSFPNIIVGIGLLLTFCGLVSAIYLTGESITSVESDDIISHSDHLKTALDSLLKVAAFKFLTSIAGLISSIFLTIVFKLLDGKIRKEFYKLTISLERNLQYESQECLLYEQSSIARLQLENSRRTSEHMRHFVENYANEMAQKTALAMNSVAKHHLERLTPALDSACERMAATVAHSLHGTTEELVTLFSQNLREETRNEAKALAETFLRLREGIEETLTCFQESGEHVSRLLLESGEGQRDVLTRILGETEESLRKNVSSLAERSEEAFTHVAQVFSGAAERIEGLGQSLENHLLNGSQHISESFSLSLKRFDETTERGGEAMEKALKNSSDALEARLLQASEQVSVSGQTLASTLSLSSEALTKTVSTLAESFTRTSEQSCDLLHAVVQDASQILEQSIQSASKELQVVEGTVCASLGLSSDALQSQVEEIFSVSSKSVEQGCDLLHKTLNAASEHLESGLSASLKQLEATQNSLSATLTSCLDNCRESLTKAEKALVARCEEVCETLSKSSLQAVENLNVSLEHSLDERAERERSLKQEYQAIGKQMKEDMSELFEGLRIRMEESGKMLEESTVQTVALVQKNVKAASAHLQNIEESVCKTIATAGETLAEHIGNRIEDLSAVGQTGSVGGDQVAEPGAEGKDEN